MSQMDDKAHQAPWRSTVTSLLIQCEAKKGHRARKRRTAGTHTHPHRHGGIANCIRRTSVSSEAIDLTFADAIRLIGPPEMHSLV